MRRPSWSLSVVQVATWFPAISAIIWWGMLIALLSCWAGQGRPVYVDMTDGETIPYISHIAATSLQPIFISCSAAQGLLFVIGLGVERYLRHAGRLPRNNRRREVWAAGIGILLAIIGQFGILFVSTFNTISFHNVHISMLVVFIVCIGLSSISNIIEYSYLDRSYKEYHYLKISTWAKIAWLIIAAGIGFSFLGLMWSSANKKNLNDSAILEWTIAFWYPFYSCLLTYDLIFPSQQEQLIDTTPTSTLVPEFSSEKYLAGLR